MNECLQILVERLQSKCGRGLFNIYDYIEACSFDMFVSEFDISLHIIHLKINFYFTENTFGVELNVQKNQNVKVLKMVNEYI